MWKVLSTLFVLPLLANAASITCNIKDYGAKSGSDIHDAIVSAHDDCVKKRTSGTTATLLVPSGSWKLATAVRLKHQNNWTFQIDGTITLAPKTIENTALWFSDSTNLHITGKGKIEGKGSTVFTYPSGTGGRGRGVAPRVIRVTNCVDVELSKLTINDAPSFSVVYTSAGGSIHDLTIVNDPNVSLTDGIDFSGSNLHVYNNDVTVGDDCVCVKNPARNFLIENNICRDRGGFVIGSLNEDTAIRDIVFRDNQAISTTWGAFIKTYDGGDGYIRNVTYKDLTVSDVQYAVLLTENYLKSGEGTVSGNVDVQGVTFDGITGTVNSKATYPVWIDCDKDTPCQKMTMKNVKPKLSGKTVTPKCEYAYGSGGCLA